MDQVISTFTPQGKIDLPSSKSYSHRALIAAFIADTESDIENINLCDDIQVTLSILRELGARFELKHNNIHFYKNEKIKKDYLEIKVNESASSLRFLLPLVGYLIPHVKFIGSESLFKRPLDIYEDLFKQQQIKFIKTKNSLEIFSSLSLIDLEINENISSQFISGWLFLLSYANANHYIKINVDLDSFAYIEMTLDILKKFGVRILKHNNLLVHSFSHFNYLKYDVEQDFSSFAFFAVLGSIKGQVEFSNLNLLSLQGDRKIIDYLIDMGAKIDFIENRIIFCHSLMKGQTISLKNNIDLGPILFVLGAFCYGKTIIKDVGRLIYKESDRLNNMITELTKAGVNIKLNGDQVEIEGKSSYQGDYLFESYNDHRISMALSIFSVLNNGRCIIKNAECVNKSYPNFYQDLFSLEVKN